jgi:trehalose-6-phosphate synthase
VFLPEAIAKAFYAGFCNDIIWPLLHYQFEPGVTNSRFDDTLWQAYVAANKAFAEVTVKAHDLWVLATRDKSLTNRYFINTCKF